MKEQMSGKVNLPLHNEQVLQPLLSFMYGKLEEVPDKLLLPLFQAADYYQVCRGLDLIPVDCHGHAHAPQEVHLQHWHHHDP